MRVVYALTVATALFAAGAAQAADAKKGHAGGPPATRAEAIAKAESNVKRAQEHLAKLKAMSDADWQKMAKERRAERKGARHLSGKNIEKKKLPTPKAVDPVKPVEKKEAK